VKLLTPYAAAAVAALALAPIAACSGSSPGATSPSTSLSVSPQDLDPATYQSVSPRDYALLIKDPDANKGRKIIVYGVVTQMDSSTGNSQMRVDTGAQLGGDYSQNTMIDAKDPSILAKVVKGDIVSMWCEVKGALTYDTTNNGHMTVPNYWVYIVKDSGAS
jgi:hypothetical protein